MQFRPREDEPELPPAERAVHDLEGVDADLGLAVDVPCVEVREPVIVEVHRDDDPQEAADGRHDVIVPRAPVVSGLAGRPFMGDLQVP